MRETRDWIGARVSRRRPTTKELSNFSILVSSLKILCAGDMVSIIMVEYVTVLWGNSEQAPSYRIMRYYTPGMCCIVCSSIGDASTFTSYSFMELWCLRGRVPCSWRDSRGNIRCQYKSFDKHQQELTWPNTRHYEIYEFQICKSKSLQGLDIMIDDELTSQLG